MKTILNKEQCKLIAKTIKPLQFRKQHLERPLLTFQADKETKLRTYLFLSAICHQTHSLINKKLNLKGWSFSEYVFTNLGKENSELLNPNFLAKLTTNQLIEKLKPLFSDDGNPNNCTLDKLDQRADFIIQISKKLNEQYNGKVENLIKKSDGFLINNGNGLYELLEKFEAFSDPLRKKSTLFAQLISHANLFQIKDKESITPVMDYQMQRLLLRTGCVEITDTELKKALQNKTPIQSDEEVRNASCQAVKIISEISNKDIFELDDLLWSLARSCCKEKTLCTDKECSKNPCTFFTFINIPEHNQCIFEQICPGKSNKEYRALWQPIVDTHYY